MNFWGTFATLCTTLLSLCFAQQFDYSAFVEILPTSTSRVHGMLWLQQNGNIVQMEGSISGLSPGYHGFHIHEKGDLGNDCRNAGSHFNPFNKNHGAQSDKHRHVGDLGNIIADRNGVANIHISDSLVSLNPSSQAYVGNLAFVVHGARDDLGRSLDAGSLSTGNAGARVACGLIELQVHENFQQQPSNHFSQNFAVVEIVPGANANIRGTIEISLNEHGIVYAGVISGLSPGLHGFHIHEFGDLGNGCRNAGGHFNPFNKNHGSPSEQDRHVGDLGNIIADIKGVAIFNIIDNFGSADPSSPAYIGNLAIVVHAGEDDLGRGGNADSRKTGNAGARAGCGLIRVQNQQHQPQPQQPQPQHQQPQQQGQQQHFSVQPGVKFATVKLVPGSNSQIRGTIEISSSHQGVLLSGQISGLTPGYHGFHIHESGDLGNQCRAAGGHFNPFNLDHGSPLDHNRHVGDLGNILVDKNGVANVNIIDKVISVDPKSTAYIGNLAIVVHAGEDDLGRGGNQDTFRTGNAGSRDGCGFIGANQQISQQSAKIEHAIATIIPAANSGVRGELRIIPIENGISITGKITGLTPGLHGFHIHERGDLGNGCRAAGGHFNPLNFKHGAPNDAERHAGDFGNIAADSYGVAVVQIQDFHASLNPNCQTYIGNRAIVIHADKDDLGRGGDSGSVSTGNAGARVGCGLIEVKNTNQQIHFPRQQVPLSQHNDRIQQGQLTLQHNVRGKRSFSSNKFFSSFDEAPFEGFTSFDGFSPFSSASGISKSKAGKKAVVKIIPGASKSVKGKLTITESHDGLIIEGTIYGLKPGLHGFHVHEKGDLGKKCQNAGPHFNPFNRNHGDVKDSHRHVGDLGNIKADKKGVASIHIFDHKGTLDPHSKAFIGNRAIVVHADKDDLGRGNNVDSRRTGNSGARSGCGIVKLQPKSSSHGSAYHHSNHDDVRGNNFHEDVPIYKPTPQPKSEVSFQDGLKKYGGHFDHFDHFDNYDDHYY